jgi:DNA-binding CsgD family transcriptional regulator
MTSMPSLVRWGLSADADLVFRTLSAFGPQTSARAARDLGLAEHRVRVALDELAAVNATTPVSAGERREREWVPAPVDRVLAALRRRPAWPDTVEQRWRRHLAAVDGIDRFTVETAAARLLPSRQLARERIAHLVRAERHEHLAINTEKVISSDAAAAARPLDQRMHAHGIRLRVLGLTSDDGDRTDPGDAGLGGEYRQSAVLPVKLMIFDRKAALFAADPVDFDAGAVEVTDPSLVAKLVTLFHRLWANAHAPRRNGVPTIVLTAREAAIVTHLSEGQSEEAIAATLGLSRRTVTYALRALMDRLGVDNRFQLALMLGAAGAVRLPGYNDGRELPCSDE